MAMNLTSYSWHPARPSVLLKWPNVSVLVDCALDFSSFNSYLPHTYSTTVFPQGDPQIDCIKRVRDMLLIDGVPEVHPTPLHALQMDAVDCILISNWNSLLALPLYVYETGFRGRIYAISATIQFGKLMIEELIEYCERMAVEEVDPSWKNPEVYSRFPNPPYRNPIEWKKFYTKEVAQKVLASIVPLSFKQSFTIFENITITPYCSGYQIGSCNWTISADHFQIGCLGSTSEKTTHVQSVQLEPFKNLDLLVINSLNSVLDAEAAINAGRLREVAMDTLRNGGNVLIPVLPTGFVYDLIELIVRSIDQTSGVSLDTPVYFISPVAKSSVAYANVNAEWLSEERQQTIYGQTLPDEPFAHSAYMKNNRFRIYENLFDPFSKEVKTPCMFCGHPSLRVGDAAHMLHLWGNESKNSLIMTCPDYPLNEVYGPFEDLKIRAYYFPVDTRLSFTDLNHDVLPRLNPKGIYIPDQYLVPQLPSNSKKDSSVIFAPCTPMSYDETLTVTNKRLKKRKIKIHPDIVKKMTAKPHPANPSYSITALKGYLSAFDDVYELEPTKDKPGALKARYGGVLTVEAFCNKLKEKQLVYNVENNCDGSATVLIPSLKSSVQISQTGVRTKIQASDESRASLNAIVTSSLVKLC